MGRERSLHQQERTGTRLSCQTDEVVLDARTPLPGGTYGQAVCVCVVCVCGGGVCVCVCVCACVYASVHTSYPM